MYILCIYVINTESEVLGYQIMGEGGGEEKGEDSTQTLPPWRGLKLAYLHSTHIDELRILLAYSDIWIFCQ